MDSSASPGKADLAKNAVSDVALDSTAESGPALATAAGEQTHLCSPNSLANGFVNHSNDEFDAYIASECTNSISPDSDVVPLHDNCEVITDSTDHNERLPCLQTETCLLQNEHTCLDRHDPPLIENVVPTERVLSSISDDSAVELSEALEDDNVREHARHLVDQVVAESVLRAVRVSEQLCQSSSICVSPPACESDYHSVLTVADANPVATGHAIANQSFDDEDECESASDSDSSLSPNQNAGKAANNNKRKKKNQRKKSNASPSATGSNPATPVNNKPAATTKNNDLASPKLTQTAQPKGTLEKNKAEHTKSNSSSSKPYPASPQSGNKVSSKIEPKCQIVSDKPKENNVQSGKKPSEEKSSSPNSVTGEGVRCDATAVATTNQTSSPAAASNGDKTSSEPQATLEDLPCELTDSKQCSESSLATEASPDQSMDDSTKLNGATGKSSAQNVAGDSVCKICAKHVYHMEQIKAVKAVFHKACFRCNQCNKQLNVDTYSSHEGVIYCKPHFKQLFQPKAVFENDDSKQTSAKQEDVFENINLDLSNIRNRFENGSDKSNTTDGKRSTNEKPITRSESIHKIMQKYQSRVAGDKEITSSSDEEDNVNESKCEESEKGSDKVAFSGMSALKSQWESGTIKDNLKSENRVQEELAELRQKVKSSEPLKNAYERAVQEAKSVENLAVNKNDGIVVDSSVKAVSIKEKFEKGKVESETEEDRVERLRKEREEEISRIAGSETCTKEARNKFKQIEANMGKDQTSNGNNGHIEDSISSNELQQRFKYFENLKDSQPSYAKESSGDETDAKVVDDIPKADTTKKMLDKFKALEANQAANGPVNGTPKSPKRITPPRETAKAYESEPAQERDPNIVRSSYKSDEDIQVEPEKAKNLRAKFENWQTEIERESRKSETEDEYVPHIDTTKNLRAMFESIKEEYKPAEKPRPRINRFVDNKAAPPGEVCYVCSSRLYPMEKMEFSGIKIHKNCFRCNKCHAPLRLDNFTVHGHGQLFCIPHFKQLFMEKGNYDEGFGLEQHKDKWSHKTATTNGKANGIEKQLNGDCELKNQEEEEVEETPSTTTNGNGVLHDDDDHESEHNEVESVEEEVRHEPIEPEEEQHYIPSQDSDAFVDEPRNDDHVDQLEPLVAHIELDEVLDGPIAVDNQA